ncbi:unnamed protein product [Paramecium primaurelia]|uniref:Uncharacterized protein n=1 Tax=Paramecium primaurelia TaxID=5886 RepID=A0A8S1MZN8_PARPR|nr:unnamed protein product [Paramecium primaurelia]
MESFVQNNQYNQKQFCLQCNIISQLLKQSKYTNNRKQTITFCFIKSNIKILQEKQLIPIINFQGRENCLVFESTFSIREFRLFLIRQIVKKKLYTQIEFSPVTNLIIKTFKGIEGLKFLRAYQLDILRIGYKNAKFIIQIYSLVLDLNLSNHLKISIIIELGLI